MNWKEKIYLYVNPTTQKCPKKIIKTLLIEEFFHLHLEIISENFRKKFEMAWGKLIHEKYLNSKISWLCPLKSV